MGRPTNQPKTSPAKPVPATVVFAAMRSRSHDLDSPNKTASASLKRYVDDRLRADSSTKRELLRA